MGAAPALTTVSIFRIEFWPDYGPGPLWGADGQVVYGADLGVPDALVGRLRSFNEAYPEDKIPVEGPADSEYLAEGRTLLAEVRAVLGDRAEVVVTAPWWGEESVP